MRLLILTALIALASCTNLSSENRENLRQGEHDMQIILTVDDTPFRVALEDNETTRELRERLPITMMMSDLHNNEKYHRLQEELPRDSEPGGDIEPGDFMLYQADTLVIFYESFHTTFSYTSLGKIENPTTLRNLLGEGDIEVTLERN